MQRFLTMPYFSIAHFGTWKKLKNLPKPNTDQNYVVAISAYTHALANLSQGKMKSFSKHYQLFQNATKANNDNPETMKAFENNLQIAKFILLAKKAQTEKNWQSSIFNWHQALLKQKAGGDPPMWYFPTTEGLGYAFLYAGKFKQAIATFEADLESHPNNGWAIQGLIDSHQALKQEQKVKQYQRQLSKIWSIQSVKLPIEQGSDMMIPMLTSGTLNLTRNNI